MNDELTKQEIDFKNDTKKNYIIYYANLVSSNIYALYKNFGNEHNLSYEQIYRMSSDIIVLNSEEIKILDRLIVMKLKEKYNLKMTEKEVLRLEKFK